MPKCQVARLERNIDSYKKKGVYTKNDGCFSYKKKGVYNKNTDVFYCVFTRIRRNRRFEQKSKKKFFQKCFKTFSTKLHFQIFHFFSIFFLLNFYSICLQSSSPLWSVVVRCGFLWSVVVRCGPLWFLVGPLRVISPCFVKTSLNETVYRF